MPDRRQDVVRGFGPWGWRTLAALLILTASALHLVYLAWDCPLDLAPDEAHYWDWSRQLDWSYYSKGPLVAYLIRASCAVFGPLSQSWTGTDMLAVRLPAVVCGGLLLMSLYILTVQVYQRESLATAVVAMALTLPPVAAGASLMTIDSPYTCCWGWALVCGFQAVFRRSAWAWPLAGLLVGLGILAKYTMVLWLPSAGLFLLTSPQHRRQLLRPGFWVLVAVAAVCCLPIVFWNVQHDWVTLRHVSGQAGLRNGLRWHGPVSYVVVQWAVLMGYWFMAWAAAMAAHRPWREADAGVRYLWWMSAPVFLVFLAFSLKTPEQPNWPITAYMSGLVLAAAWLVQQLRDLRPWYRRSARVALAVGCGLGLVMIVFMHFSIWLQPLLLRVSGPATASRPFPLRRFDPTCRLRGWRALASEVDATRAQLQAEGVEPVLAGSAWNVPGEIAFYCAGRPRVYSLGLPLGDRHSQYDFWRPNPVHDLESFAGRTFVYVGEMHPILREAFERVDEPRWVVYREGGQPISCWCVTVCRGYRGFRHPGVGQHY